MPPIPPKSVPFPVALDKFGTELQNVMMELQKNGVLKTALMSDLVKIYGAIFWMQQLLAAFFNMHMHDYSLFSRNYEELKKRHDELETRTAGYSERINILEAEVRKSKEEVVNKLIKELVINSKFREMVKKVTI